jgi:transcriptional regulator with GAF, ATPase, and Fis domain
LRVTGAVLPNGAEVQLGSVTLNVIHGQEREPVALWPRDSFGELVGASASMREVFAQLARLAGANAPVMIRGETGTGKELAARAIHDASPRAAGPFVVVDCAALPPTLVESELFGHARGAFTGALCARAGAFEAAHGGSVFLDEVGELPLAVQPKLLRVLESSSVRRVGESEYRPVDVRVVSATHRDLRQMVNAGAFREDLYFRLAVLPVVLPPLRTRPADIPMLVEKFLADRQLSDLDLDELMHRPWLGNVRELKNFVEQACALGAAQALSLGAQVEVSDALPAECPGSSNPGAISPVSFNQKFKSFREAWIDCGEREYVERLLKRCDYSVARAAREAGLDRTYVYRLIRKYRL